MLMPDLDLQKLLTVVFDEAPDTMTSTIHSRVVVEKSNLDMFVLPDIPEGNEVTVDHRHPLYLDC